MFDISPRARRSHALATKTLPGENPYRFETLQRDATDANLASCLASVPLGEAAQDWAELITSTSVEKQELIIHGIYRAETFLGIAVLTIIRGLALEKYIAKPLATLLKLFFAFDIGFLEIPLMNQPGILTIQGVDALERGQILDALRQHLRRSLRLDALFIKTDGSILPSVYARCFANTIPMAFLPNAILEFPYASTDAYWARQPGKKRRKFRAESRILEQHGARVRIREDIAAIQERVFQLYQNTVETARQKPHYIEMPVSINSEFFSAIFRLTHLRPRMITVEINDVVIASGLVFSSGNTLHLKAIGLDYRLSQQSRAYFSLYYALLDHAAREGCTRIDMSVTSYRFKQWLGCELYPTAYACEVYNPIGRLIGQRLIPLVERRMSVHNETNPALDSMCIESSA